MINVASCVYGVSGIALFDALWNIPAALAYQLQIIAYQRQGSVFKRDNKEQILKELED